jgi:hypothetical protein
MSDPAAVAPALAKPPAWYWIVSVLLFLWMCIGLSGFVADRLIDYSTATQFTEAERALYASTPMWLTVVYGIATIAGFIGAIGLLVRKAWSTRVLTVSLAAVIVQFSFWLLGTAAIEVLGPSAVAMPIFIAVAGGLAIWFARSATSRGWMR